MRRKRPSAGSGPRLQRGRAAWRTALTDAVTNGAGGLLVPAGPRLLDILRNPNDPDDRRDLQLAQG